MQSITALYADCHYAECLYAECHGAVKWGNLLFYNDISKDLFNYTNSWLGQEYFQVTNPLSY